MEIQGDMKFGQGCVQTSICTILELNHLNVTEKDDSKVVQISVANTTVANTTVANATVANATVANATVANAVLNNQGGP
jgi:hypothetical protein